MKRYSLLFIGALLATPYLLKPFYRQWGTRATEAKDPLPGDDMVSHPKIQYTLAITVNAPPQAIWPWLVQMGRGRAGFYTMAHSRPLSWKTSGPILGRKSNRSTAYTSVPTDPSQ
jgi:hypothetical protein